MNNKGVRGKKKLINAALDFAAVFAEFSLLCSRTDYKRTLCPVVIQNLALCCLYSTNVAVIRKAVIMRLLYSAFIVGILPYN